MGDSSRRAASREQQSSTEITGENGERKQKKQINEEIKQTRPEREFYLEP